MKKFKCPKCQSWIGFCANCNDVRRFLYDKNIGHSSCSDCGISFATPIVDRPEEEIIRAINRRITVCVKTMQTMRGEGKNKTSGGYRRVSGAYHELLQLKQEIQKQPVTPDVE